MAAEPPAVAASGPEADPPPRVSSSADLADPAHSEGSLTRSELLLAEASPLKAAQAASASSASSPDDPGDEAGDETAALLPSVKPPPVQRSLLNALPSFGLGSFSLAAHPPGPPAAEELERTDSDHRRLGVRGAAPRWRGEGSER